MFGEEEYIDFEDETSEFDESSCTCDHDTIDHGYEGCEVEGCDCEATWD